MSHATSDARGEVDSWLDEPRGSFGGSLEWKVASARAALVALEDQPDDIATRNELRRKLHALYLSAKVLRLEGVAAAVDRERATLEAISATDGVSSAGRAEIRRTLSEISVLAWNDPPAPSSRTVSSLDHARPPCGVLLFVASALSDALGDRAWHGRAYERDELRLEYEHIQDAATILDKARALAVDLIVVDADLDTATGVVDALFEDPVTESIPIVVVGSFDSPDAAAHYTALGVAKTLATPLSMDRLSEACAQVLSDRDGAPPPPPLEVREAVELTPPGRDLARTIAARGASPEVRLRGMRALVVDDHPAVAWFVADCLRKEGCDVHEVLDGNVALNSARANPPDIILCDIVMPGIDGMALCRELRRDVALHATPILLLSWKADLLNRAQELGVEASGYLLKESDPETILSKIREVIAPRALSKALLWGVGEAQGRVDGQAMSSLLEWICDQRRSATLTVRDASFLYEIDIRDHAPCRVIRTASDGSQERGDAVFASLLGVRAGRFAVVSSQGHVLVELHGTLHDQLTVPIARARAALDAVTGKALYLVRNLVLDATTLEGYLQATPEPSRTLVRRLAQGASPRALLLEQDTAPGVLDDLLCHMTSQGLVLGAVGFNGEDLMALPLQNAHHVMNGLPVERFNWNANEPPPAIGWTPLGPPVEPYHWIDSAEDAHAKVAPITPIVWRDDERVARRTKPLGSWPSTDTRQPSLLRESLNQVAARPTRSAASGWRWVVLSLVIGIVSGIIWKNAHRSMAMVSPQPVNALPE